MRDAGNDLDPQTTPKKLFSMRFSSALGSIAAVEDISAQRIRKAMERAGRHPLMGEGGTSFDAYLDDVARPVCAEPWGPVELAQSVAEAAEPTWAGVYFNLGAADGAIHVEDMRRRIPCADTPARMAARTIASWRRNNL